LGNQFILLIAIVLLTNLHQKTTKENMKQKIAIEIISFLFILLFLYAAFTKLLDYQKFTVQIGQSPLLTGFGNTLPWLVITIEILIALLLTIARFRLVAFFAAFSLMTMFTAYIVAILNFSSHIPCSCGGVLEKLGWTEHLIFNGVFMALAVTGIFLHAHLLRKYESISDTQPATL
jgi:uncharacterized membrane protein YphA (DoxX/SURF4 family)